MDLTSIEDQKVISQTALDNGYMLLVYEDGTTAIVKVASINDSGILRDALKEEEDEDEEEEDEEEEEEEDKEDEEDEEEEDEEEEDDLTWDDIKNSDFEELEDIIDENKMDIDIDDYEDKKKSITKLRKDIAKELDIKITK